MEALFFVSTPCKPWLDAEEAQARGLDLDKSIILSIKFTNPKLYMYSMPVVSVRQTDKKNFNEVRDSDLHSFGLSWPMEDRIKKHLESKFELWRSECNMQEKELSKMSGNIESLDSFLDMLGKFLP